MISRWEMAAASFGRRISTLCGPSKPIRAPEVVITIIMSTLPEIKIRMEGKEKGSHRQSHSLMLMFRFHQWRTILSSEGYNASCVSFLCYLLIIRMSVALDWVSQRTRRRGSYFLSEMGLSSSKLVRLIGRDIDKFIMCFNVLNMLSKWILLLA